jgi:hypothetical protein
MSTTAEFFPFSDRTTAPSSWPARLLARLFRRDRRRPARLHPEQWSAHMLRDVGLAEPSYMGASEYPSATSQYRIR